MAERSFKEEVEKLKLGAFAEIQLFDLFLERAFRHFGPFGTPVNPRIRLYSMGRAAESARIRGKGVYVAPQQAGFAGRFVYVGFREQSILSCSEWPFGAAENGRTRPTFDNSPTHGVSCRTSIL